MVEPESSSNTNSTELAKRCEILFFYDSKMSNPNGDPDENRPRIDRITKKNLVTEFRLKRTIRDYLEKIMEKKIFMRREYLSAETLVLKQIEDLASEYISFRRKDKDSVGNIVSIKKEEYEKNKKNSVTSLDRKKLLADHIDVRLFGLLFTVSELHFKQIGPVQFSIGQSLNDVEEILVRMTRIVPTKEEATSGTFGEKYILRYSFIEFHGFVNDIVAKDVNLTEKDVKDMLVALWRGTDSLSTSSKFGQKSRLLLKVNFKEHGYIGDIDRKCTIEQYNNVKTLENVSQFALKIDGLQKILQKNKDIIQSIEYESNSELMCRYNNFEESFSKIIEGFGSDNEIEIRRLNL
jgi:CRISPR-associated protein Csh2